ncbi:MAG: UvrD-helicase domain-containing protein [Chloroflexi bacterium]|uniref:DNA 3'-5' helicase n=1 Tax=Candidatus Chlorohelix allophototropha TaxID=3003348 RepID=A0A8T7LRL0_9CHLR|nr:UvrD-helicase domain-containing protein [Chloroflexota bacterium]WJW66517.1 UvrD-helicase domain-containing protein [Chloroflexota bacterium L227-S17]
MAAGILDGLNPAQRDAAATIEGPVLILAGPGSGKTRVLTQRIAYMLSEAQPRIDAYNILSVTFTNKAAREMKERTEKLLVKYLGQENSAAKRLTLGTFHSFCVRVLRQDANYIGLDRNFAIYDDDDQTALVKSSLNSLGLSDKQYSPRACLSMISSAKNTLQEPRQFREVAQTYFEEIAARVYERYQELLRTNRALDFDDLIGQTIRLLRENKEVLERYQERYRYIMVDEYQDTNHAQYQLIHALADKYQNLCVVGDENQSIYGWRAADIRNILNFESDYPQAKVIALEQNYRSTQTILDAATAIIAANTQRKDKALWTENESGRPIQVFEAYNEMEEANYVVGEIDRLQVRGEFKPKDVAVLYRTNAQSRALEEMFIRRGIPYQLIGGTRFYERKEVKDALAFLRLIQNPYDSISFTRIITNTPAGKGIGPRTLIDLSQWANQMSLPIYVALQLLQSQEADKQTRRNAGEPEESNEEDLLPPLNVAPKIRNALLDFVNLLEAFIRARGEMTLLELFDYVMEKSGYELSLRDGSEEGEERWHNVQELRTVCQEYNHMPGNDALPAFMEDVALVADVDKFNPDADAATLITLHAAKGLEFPVVFIVGLEEGILPHSRSLENENQLEEERRLLYVGITRAKNRLYLVYAFRRSLYGGQNIPTKPSRFLLDLPSQLVKGYQQAPTGSPHGGRGTGSRDTLWGTDVNRTNWGNTTKPAPAKPAALSKPATPTRPAATGNISLKFKAGEKVLHPKFGKGMVVSSRISGNDEEATVAFEGQGIKKLMVSLANLQKI